MYNDNALYSERNRILFKTLGNDLYNQVKSFFSYLFPKDVSDSRVYIILTRKGFSLWHAFALCGLLEVTVPQSDILMSDRRWKKMSEDARAQFVNNRDVYIVDDTILTGNDVSSIYKTLDSLSVKSRQIVCMVKSIYYDAPDYCKYFGDVTNSERRIQYCKLMVALYKLAIPFSAEATFFHAKKMPRSIIREWKEWNKSNPKLGWYSETDSLDFGIAGKIDTTFLLHAPAISEAENILFRGVRVCYRDLSIEEDKEQEFAEVSFVPWVMFDILDYEKAVAYLIKHSQKGSWLSNQILSSDNIYKCNIVHRVISYLLGACVKREFDNWLNRCKFNLSIEPYHLFNANLESYHHDPELLTDMYALVEKGCNITDGANCPYHDLLINKIDYSNIAKDLLETFLISANRENVYAPNSPTDIRDLESILCENRERDVDKETGKLLEAKIRFKYPLIFYTGNDRGIKALDYIRRSIASFHSVLLTDKNDKVYLANALVSGEGSSLAYYKNYDFIWALHQLIFFKAYTHGIEQTFASFWNKKIAEGKNKAYTRGNMNSEYFRLNEVEHNLVNTLINITCGLWPPREEIMDYYEKGNGPISDEQSTPFDLVWDIAKEFANTRAKKSN